MAKTLDEARKKLDDEYGQIRRHLQNIHDALDKVEQAGPEENEICHGCGPSLLIASRFAVASSSPWPPERNTMPATAAGTTSRKHAIVASATACGDDGPPEYFLPGITMFGFNSMPSS